MIKINMQLAREPVINPGKGWVLYGTEGFYTEGVEPYNGHSEEAWNLCSLGYMRYHWCDLEPEEGIIRWELIEAPLRECIRRGKRFAFGFMPANSCTVLQSAVPEYVFQTGAGYTTCRTEDNLSDLRSEQKIPVWDDPIYMDKIHNFILQLGKRYNGHPDIEFIDIRNYGNWGEWHIEFLEGSLEPPEESLREHIQMWTDSFPSTRLILPVNGSEPTSLSEWAVQHGIGLRRDGIIVLPEDHKAVLPSYGIAPSVGEFYGWYSWLIANGKWNSQKLREIVDEGHFTFMGMGHWQQDGTRLLNENRQLLWELNNRLGYHFVVEEVVLPSEWTTDFNIQVRLINKGVAPIYRNAILKIAILDQANNVLESYEHATCNPRTWMPDEVVSFDVQTQWKQEINSCKLALGLFTSWEQLQPDINFGNECEFCNGWLVLHQY
ncbi:DUF4832 domain-containing protein [Paenibacillus roseipurpureus]|uniref:DUF4832 domain-containing protein n=1 Tax=Paenibacillus roseopurpureus TaxID=2918901 RepID=A0AA96LWP6_9BACL|nr:DUF4832 domain-containing protein [Paenibacillus sp. MBLB1832]WNR46060.1 DUF4832 domain-containing protein [Paenibacillus sp. MBLB1832]